MRPRSVRVATTREADQRRVDWKWGLARAALRPSAGEMPTAE
jgi:hypothetical protein